MPRSGAPFDLTAQQAVSRLHPLIWIALAIHWVTAVFSLGPYQADEHFQILEFLNQFLGRVPNESMAWEFHAKMRPWIQPLAFLPVVRALEWMGIGNPVWHETVLRLMVSTLGWCSSVLLAVAVTSKLLPSIKESSRPRARGMFWLVLLFAWFVPFMHARISAESVGASLFWMGFAIHLLWPSRVLWVGFLMGLAFYVRFQIGIMIAAWWSAVWLAEWMRAWARPSLKKVYDTFGALGDAPLEKKVLRTFCAALAIGVLCDRIGYGEWVLTPVEYFRQNLVEGKLAGFGRLPWWAFFKLTTFNLPPLSSVGVLLAGWGMWIGFKTRNLLALRLLVMIIPFFVVHSLLAWKELRFLFPILPAGLIFVAIAIIELANRWPKLKPLTIMLAVLNGGALIVLALRPAFHRVPLYQALQKMDGAAVYLEFAGAGDPYGGPGQELSFRFYQNPRLNWLPPVRAGAELSAALTQAQRTAHQNIFVYSMKCPAPTEFESQLAACRVVYQRFSNWMRHFNWNDWMSRAPCDRVWECRGPEHLSF